MHALLWLNGEVSGLDIAQLQPPHYYARIVAVDGGLRHALAYGYTPHVVLGDFDSASQWHQGPWQIIHRPNPQFTDLAKALDYCRELGIDTISLVGGLGGWLDHSLANLSLLSSYRSYFQQQVYGPRERLFWLSSSLQLRLKIAQRLSLLAMPYAEGVTSQGLLYPLEDDQLQWGGWQGISNQASETLVQLTLNRGLILVCVAYEVEE